MQFKTRLFTLMLALLLTLVVGQAALAQDDPGCFDLPAEDCAVINAAIAKLDEVDSFSFEVEADVSVSGLGLLAALGMVVPEEMSFSLDADGVLNEVAEEGRVNFALAMDAGEDSVERAASMVMVEDMEYMIVDGKAYTVEPGEDDMSDDMGTDLEELDLTELTDMADFGALSEQLTSYGLDPSAFISYTRDGDSFTMTLDVGGLLNSPEMLAMIGMLAGDDPTMSAMLEPVMAGIVSELSTVEVVNADGYLSSMELNFFIEADLSALLGPTDPVVVELAVFLGMNDINMVDAVAAPEGVTVLTQEEADAMMDEFVAPFEDFLEGLGVADLIG